MARRTRQETTDRPGPDAGLRLGFLVHDVSRMRRTLFDQAMKPFGVTRSQWWVLANVSRHADVGVIQADLARTMDVGKVTIGSLIDRLEATGHVERRTSPEDRRAKRIYLTARGEKVLAQMASVGEQLNQTILSGVSTAEVKGAEDVLQAMKENLRRALSIEGSATDEPV